MKNPNSRTRDFDHLKLKAIMMVGCLFLGLVVGGVEQLFSIPESSTLSGVLGSAAVGVFSVLWFVLLCFGNRRAGF